MKKCVWKKALKICVFLALICVVWVTLNSVLKRRNDGNWYGGGIERSYENPDYYDVIFSGTSMVLANVSMEELYLEYGIAGLTTGEPEQPAYLSYYTLEEVLKYQSPKAVFFDVKALFYSDELLKSRIDLDENLYVHYTLDQIKNNGTKYNALKAVQELNSDLDIWTYLSKMYNNHANWEDLQKINFKSDTEVINRIDGNTLLFDIEENLERTESAWDVKNTGECESISDFNMKYFLKIINLCKEKNIDLVLLRGHTDLDWDWKKYNAIEAIATQYGLDYLDINLCEEEIGFDWHTDSADSGHTNVLGARKWTDYIGKYLVDHYEIKDHRNDSNYDHYLQQEEKYQAAIDAVQTKANFLNAVTMNEYCDTLGTLDWKNNSVYVIASKSVLQGLSAEMKEKIKYMGSQVLMPTDGESGENKYGLQFPDKETVKIGETEIPLYVDGINILIFNRPNSVVISSVYFDVIQNDNPITSRITNGRYVEKEVGINKWKAYE